MDRGGGDVDRGGGRLTPNAVAGSASAPRSGWASLTPTELEVVKLVAKGLTNPEIAERLFITRNTVRAHLQHVFAKLGVKTRAELRPKRRAAASRLSSSPQGFVLAGFLWFRPAEVHHVFRRSRSVALSESN